LVARGLGDVAIAAELTLSPRTVQAHLRSAFRKLGVRNRTAAVHRATQLGLVGRLGRPRATTSAESATGVE
jgi:DNA-binding NarL/FixJ family response regulator